MIFIKNTFLVLFITIIISSCALVKSLLTKSASQGGINTEFALQKNEENASLKAEGIIKNDTKLKAKRDIITHSVVEHKWQNLAIETIKDLCVIIIILFSFIKMFKWALDKKS